MTEIIETRAEIKSSVNEKRFFQTKQRCLLFPIQIGMEWLNGFMTASMVDQFKQ